MISPDNPLLAAWSETLARNAERPAIFAEDGRVLRTFTQIESEAIELQRRFDPFPQRSVIALQIGNSPRWPALLIALMRRRLIPLPVGADLAPAELDLALATCGTSALVTRAKESIEIAPRPGPRAGAWPDADFLKLTSGTTALPRAIRFRADQLIADCANICATMEITLDDLNYGVIPMSHSYGFSNLLLPLIAQGVSLVASEDRLPRAIIEGLVRTRATVFPGMPIFFQHLNELADVPDLPSLRLCISAGAPLTPIVAHHFAEAFARKIHVFYGSSECGGIAYDAAPKLQVKESGFVGTPLRGVSITPLDEGEETTRIAVRSAAVGEGYFPEKDSATLGGGCFVPNDLVRFTPDGLVLAGRVVDFINIAGRKLNPAEVEQCLLAYPGIEQAIVFGVRSRARGEETVACVAGQGLDAQDILRFCRRELSAWKIPRHIWIVPEIRPNERGKISRRSLFDEYLKNMKPCP